MVFTCTESSFQNAHQVKIYTREYIPSESVSTVFLFLHGVGEHCSRFHDFFSYLANNFIAVFAMDHQGHGKSGGARFDIKRFDTFVADVNQFSDLIRARFQSQDLKYVVCGFSFGGLVAALVGSQIPRRWDGVLLVAPAVGVEQHGIRKVQESFAPIIKVLLPKVRAVPLGKLEDLSRDPHYLKDYEEDPLVNHHKLRVRLGVEMLRGMKQLRKQESNMTAPLLILHGERDVITSPRLSRKFFDRVPSANKTYKSLPGQVHAILNEPERDTSIASIVEWTRSI
ncbi:hypothetical protein ACHHYP_15927 [Achlya hypogyna]|uniref:Serine aminopeptidase S33 domain-containing protein n=1 Tax=Achlya hypogyna TaxID=1202772 RepID=A0A1V9YA01_ACHHY|nr:hypothetical protein ACHHYP_15927 [Achlya hypogyna]